MKNLVLEWKNLKRENYNCISLNNFIAYNFAEYGIENVFLPVFIKGKKVQFTNICFTSSSSGNDYFLILIGDKYKFLNYGYEPDSDGGYYFHYIVDLFDVTDKEQYTMVREICTKDVYKLLINY